MPKKPLIKNAEYPFYVTARTKEQDWFYLPMEDVWFLFSKYAGEISEKYDVKIHAMVVMPKQFHLLLTTPGGNLAEAINYLLGEISKSVNRYAKRITHAFTGPFQWSLIEFPLHYLHTLKYVYRTPIKAELCEVVEQYDFSSLRNLVAGIGTVFPVYDSKFYPWNILGLPPMAQLNWLNLKYEENEEEFIKKALSLRRFQIAPDPKTMRCPRVFDEPM